MKKIINGKTYNTETADFIEEASANCACNDFEYFEESLYKTKKGAWFMYGSGNAASKYSEPGFTGGSQSGDRMFVLSPSGAFNWLEKNEHFSEIEEHFSDILEEA